MSKDDDFSKDEEWLEALEIEPEKDDDKGADDKKDDDDKGDDDGNADDDKGSDDGSGADDDSKGDEDSADDDTKGADDSKGADGDGDKADGSKDDEEDKDGKKAEGDEKGDEAKEEPVDVKTAVREALQESEAEKVDRSNRLEGYKAEVTKTLYPEGIDRTLRDSDGDPITGIDDLTKLINPATQDYFTDEEAGAWLLRAQQKLNQDVATVEKFIEDVAETNYSLEQGSARVAEKYEKVLTANPELKDRLLAGYNKTLIKDPKTGVAIKAPVDVVEFFDLALEPMLKQQADEAEAASKAAEEAKKAAEEAKKKKQQDRGDLKQTGKGDSIPEKDKEWAQAYKDYEEGDTL